MCKCLCKCLFELIIVLLMLPIFIISLVLIGFGSYFLAVSGEVVKSMVSSSDSQEFINYLTNNLTVACIIIIVSGVVLLVFSILGMCGACCKSVCMMATFSALMGLLAIGSLITSIVYLTNPSALVTALSSVSSELIKKNFDDLDNPSRKGNTNNIDLSTVALIKFMQKYECCGVSSYTEFQESKVWNRKYVYSNETVEVAQVPVMCCRNRQNTTAGSTWYYSPGNPASPATECLRNPTPDNSFMQVTCVNAAIGGTLSQITWIMFGVAMGLVVIFVMAVILTCCYSKKSKVSHNMHEMTRVN